MPSGTDPGTRYVGFSLEPLPVKSFHTVLKLLGFLTDRKPILLLSSHLIVALFWIVFLPGLGVGGTPIGDSYEAAEGADLSRLWGRGRSLPISGQSRLGHAPARGSRCTSKLSLLACHCRARDGQGAVGAFILRSCHFLAEVQEMPM